MNNLDYPTGSISKKEVRSPRISPIQAPQALYSDNIYSKQTRVFYVGYEYMPTNTDWLIRLANSLQQEKWGIEKIIFSVSGMTNKESILNRKISHAMLIMDVFTGAGLDVYLMSVAIEKIPPSSDRGHVQMNLTESTKIVVKYKKGFDKLINTLHVPNHFYQKIGANDITTSRRKVGEDTPSMLQKLYHFTLSKGSLLAGLKRIGGETGYTIHIDRYTRNREIILHNQIQEKYYPIPECMTWNVINEQQYTTQDPVETINQVISPYRLKAVAFTNKAILITSLFDYGLELCGQG